MLLNKGKELDFLVEEVVYKGVRSENAATFVVSVLVIDEVITVEAVSVDLIILMSIIGVVFAFVVVVDDVVN